MEMSKTVKDLEHEYTKDVPDMKVLRIKLMMVDAAWEAYHEAYDTCDNTVAGEEEISNLLPVCLTEDRFKELEDAKDNPILWGL